MDKPLICYHTPSLSSFVKKDIEILETEYQVNVFLFASPKKWQTPIWFLKQLVFLLKNRKALTQICQFAGYHSFLPSIFSRLVGRKSIVVAGGTDCVSFPELGYGNFHKKLLGFFTCASFKLSDAIISVDESLIQTDSSYSTSHSSKQGIRIHCKQSTSDIEVIYNGYSSNFWQKLPESNLQGDIISVSAGLSERRRFILKGIDLLFELAVRKPEIKITVVGSHKLPEGIIKPANVTIVGNASPELLRELYSGHTYYAQLSISEGFPNAICEAMLCECIPIGSNVAAMPKIIGKEGYLLHKRSIDDLENLINLANKEWSMKSFSPRKRIMEHFSIETRKERMLEFIRNLHSAGLKN